MFLGIDWAVVAAAFVPLLLLELPDKTFIATLILSTRFRPWLAWIGVTAAFGVQVALAVVAGSLVAQLPREPVLIATAALFAIGGIILWRGARSADQRAEEEANDLATSQLGRSQEATATATETQVAQRGTWGTRLAAIGTSFGVVFLAEFGDLSQLFVAGLSARYQAPVSVFIGAWAALAVVAGLGAGLGKLLLAKMRLALIQRIGAIVCLILAAITALELFGIG